MTQKSTKAILSIALCTCLLSGCSISITPASSSASSTPLSNSENNSDTNSTDTSASAPPSPTPAATASVDEPVESASGDVLPESTPAQNEQISVFPDNEAQKSDLALYTQTLGRFFHSPMQTSVYKGYKRDKIEMRGDRAEMSDFPLYLNTVAGGLDRRDQTIGGFSFVVKIYAPPVVEIIGQLLYLLGRYGFNAQFGDCL